MLKDKTLIMNELNHQRGQLSYYNSEHRELVKIKQDLDNSISLIKKCYETHYTIFDSTDISNLCRGFGINLSSACKLGKEATLCLKGNPEKNCRKAYETEINETSRQISRLEKSIENYHAHISNIQAVIKQLESELRSL